MMQKPSECALSKISYDRKLEVSDTPEIYAVVQKTSFTGPLGQE